MAPSYKHRLIRLNKSFAIYIVSSKLSPQVKIPKSGKETLYCSSSASEIDRYLQNIFRHRAI